MLRLSIGCVLAAIACGCAADGTEVDPLLEIGLIEEGEFRLLQDGMECPIVQAVQGGYWSMPTLRTQGIDSSATVGCTLVDLDRDLTLGTSESLQRFHATDDGWQELLFLLSLDAVTTPEEFAAVDLHAGTFSCWVSDPESEFDSDAIVASTDVSVLLRSVALAP